MPLRNFLLVLACWHALLAPAQARARYTANSLAGTGFAPTGVNDAGQSTNVAASGTGATQAVPCSDGVLERPATSGAGSSVVVHDLHVHGTLAGTASDGEQGRQWPAPG